MPAGTSDMKTIIASPTFSDQKVRPTNLSDHARPVRETAHAEQQQADTEHAIDTEQRGMTVRRGHVHSLHIVESDRRVEREAQEASADDVPETDGDKAQDRPFVRLHPGGSLGTLKIAPGLDTPIIASGTTSSAENIAPMAITEVGVPGEVEVVQCAENATEQEDNGFQNDRAVGGRRADQAETGEQQGDDGGGEDLEETLYPQVHQPPAPIFDHRIVRFLTPGQRSGVKSRRCTAQQGRPWRSARGFRTVCAARASARGRAASPRSADQPNNRDLPDTAHAGVLEPLVTDPETVVIADILQGAQPTGERRTGDDDQQGIKQYIDTQALVFWFAAEIAGAM